ncbi:hypothetical protein EX895_000158 [Sporisorium graminicola]|uniref:Uncharacterized protein n=1 Tax=Sporisorium graminicola TaxID=280036 RepID=A0A4U7L025_9BASI|nr:hypothetical protein EX895_000158 [Sporisorium graminicola]TKY90160.1 hypothetical protein EX895_000158 [Sporisorium graminicola]
MSSSSSAPSHVLSPTSTSGSMSSSQSRSVFRRLSNFSNASSYSRASWCSTTESEVSISSTQQGHISHHQDSLDKLVLANMATNAIFGSTSPRKNRSSGMRSSTDSARSWASSSSSVRSPRTPSTPLFSHPERDVTQTPKLTTVALPCVADVPRLKKPHLSRIVSEEVQYIGRSLDVPVSEEGHEEHVNPVNSRASNAFTSSCNRHPASSSRFSTWNGKDGLMIALDELEQELARTMVALSTSANNTPVSSVSKARGKSMRRPHTTDTVMASSSAKSLGLARGAHICDSSSSVSTASQARFQRESWMSSTSDCDEDVLSYASRPIRFSASDLTLLSDPAELSKRSDADREAERPSSHAESDSLSVPALVFDGRLSGSSVSSSGVDCFQEAPSRPDSFVTADNGHVSLLTCSASIKSRARPSTARASSPQRTSFYESNKGVRSTPLLASEPPRIPLPPLPSLPSGLSSLLASPMVAPPRPPKSLARRPTSSHGNCPVPFLHKPLPSLPC